MAYQGPNVTVRQNFTQTPAQTTVEQNPAFVIATAYDVFRRSSLGVFIGSPEAAGIKFPWVAAGVPVTNVSWDKNTGRRYEMFPVVVTAQQGNLEKVLTETEDYVVGADGVVMLRDAAYTISSVPATSDIKIPGITILSADIVDVTGRLITVSTNVDLAAAGVIAGLPVSNGAVETSIKSVNGQVIETVDEVTQVNTKIGYNGTNLCTITRTQGSFLTDGIRNGDIAKFVVEGSTDAVKASVISATAKVVTFNITTVAKPVVVGDVHAFQTAEPTKLTSLSFERLIGFCGATNVGIAGTWASNVFTPTAAWTTIPAIGDYINDAAGKTAVVISVNGNAVTTDVALTVTTIDVYKNDIRFSSKVLANFRSVNTDYQGSIQKIDGVDAISKKYARSGSIDDCNELAFMVQAAFAASGRVVYAANVMPDDMTAYNDVIDNSMLNEVYSFVLGTTKAGINALLPAHVNAASDPYEAHERIGITCYDERDVFILGSSIGTVASLTVTGLDWLVAAGVQNGDECVLTDGTDTVITTVTSTPTSDVLGVASVGELTGDVTATVRSNDPSIQADKIAALAVGNRRITTIWPGWFQATNSQATAETRQYPPYYIASAIAGLDSGLVPSQSLTNYKFSVPGLSSIVLNTNFRFRKAQLDTIGGGGIDIMIQDQNVTNVIYSRHDLTTNMDSIEYRERSAAKQVDTVAKLYRGATKPYLGLYNINGDSGNRLISFLKKVAAMLNTTLIKGAIIANIVVNSIKKDDVVADKLNWDLTVTIYVAGNYYDITLNVVS